MNKLKLIGQKFNRLLVIKEVFLKKDKTYWECRCDCGNISVVAGSELTTGGTKSCGCLQREEASKTHKKHGLLDSSEYNSWANAKVRCYNKNYSLFSCYGGRGIKMCDRWKNSFEFFLFDMGKKPSPNHTLDRYPNVNGDYEPTNCRWANFRQQQSNRRNNIWIEYLGIKMIQADWARLLNISSQTITNHRRVGYPFSKTFKKYLPFIAKEELKNLPDIIVKEIHQTT